MIFRLDQRIRAVEVFLDLLRKRFVVAVLAALVEKDIRDVHDRQMVGALVEAIPRQHDDGELQLVADRGYISGALCQRLLSQGVELLTRSRSNMKPMVFGDEQEHWIRQRGRIETVFGIMKNHMGLEHSRHRSFKGFISHVLAVVTAYAFRPNKPSMSPWTA